MPIRVAFPGSYCHPLSPVKIDKDSEVKYDENEDIMIDDNDQLIKICNRKLDTINTSFLNDPA